MKRPLNIPTWLAFFLTGLCFAVSGTVTAQSGIRDTLIARFDHFRKNNLQEKLYLHTDRNFYLTGELIWFKIYCVDGSFHRPLSISKVVYAELIDGAKEKAVTAKIELSEGSGKGSLYLPASMSSGTYQLRAYTNWMKNGDPEFYFSKEITVINPFIKLDADTSRSASQVKAKFFPEGGSLLAGQKSNVGFELSLKGAGIDGEGYVLNETNDTLTYFKTLKFGMGHFDLLPKPDHQYRAVIQTREGTMTAALPPVKAEGIGMRLTEQDDKIQITVTGQPVRQPVGPYVYLFIHARQVLVRADVQPLQNGVTIFEFNKRELPQGISHITLFNDQLKPLAERLYFVAPQAKMKLEVKANQTIYQTREKVSIDVQADVSSTLSISVFKLDSLAKVDKSFMYEYLWLTSDLKGLIESPEYYFSNDAHVKEAADNLMLTHGWSRFKWKDVTDQKPLVAFIPEYTGPLIYGKIVDESGAPKSGIMGYVSVPGRPIYTYGSWSDTSGTVMFEMKDYYGNKDLIAQTNTSKDTLYHLEIKSPFSDQYSQLPGQLHLASGIEKQLLSRSVQMQVQNSYHNESRYLPHPSDSIPFYGTPDQTYFLDDYTRFPVMEEVMREYVTGVRVRKRKDGFHFLVMDNVDDNIFRDDPLILIDGVPVFSVDEVMAMNPLKIKKIEVVTRRYYLGELVCPGVVSYSTYRNDLDGFSINPKSVKVNFEGLQLDREFYTPDYGNFKNGRIPDQRSLLYWNPDLNTMNGKNAQVTFYTSDLEGKFAIVVEGLSDAGKAGYAVSEFEVNK